MSSSEDDGPPEEVGFRARVPSDASDSDDDVEADVSFEARARQAADGSAASRSRRQVDGASASKLKRKAEGTSDGPRKRPNKHAPVEEKIAKRPVDPLRDAIQLRGAHRRDPRFADTTSQEQDATTRKRYAFLFDEQIPQELKELKAQLKRETDPSARRRLQARLSRLQQALKQEQDRRVADEVEADVKKAEREAVARGKRVFHLKASERKKLVLAKKFEKLKAAGQLEAYMAKRRKRNAAKDHRRLPAPASSRQQAPASR